MLSLEFNGSIYEVAFRKVETLRKPRQRLVQYYPKFKHLSNLYPIDDHGKVFYLFDDGNKAYRWINLEDPKGYEEVPATEYLSLKSDWLEQQKYKLSQKKKEEEERKKQLEQAQKEAEEAKKALEAKLAQEAKEKQLKAEAEKKAKELEEQKKKEKAQEELAEARRKAIEERRAKLESEKKAAIIATHVVKEDETLSHIALKYYKHATPPYWQLLLEHNTELLQGNERNVRAGMELEIPELPEELKD